MDKRPDTSNNASEKSSDDSTTRREFLRKSVYAAYATPLITALLVEQASADSSNACEHTNRPPWCDETSP